MWRCPARGAGFRFFGAFCGGGRRIPGVGLEPCPPDLAVVILPLLRSTVNANVTVERQQITTVSAPASFRLLEECYTMNDPFTPQRDTFLILGSHCCLCNTVVCVGQEINTTKTGTDGSIYQNYCTAEKVMYRYLKSHKSETFHKPTSHPVLLANQWKYSVKGR
ncbi:cysteine-rich DPF motif domain-containing protein 1 isoform X2 [Chiloscyllium plagiosum]|uniref:cysteine-rich DPF motif domain-containing protein 1 isoform X2 n=1 Tax=Chiloscyllium plagiosum TaxID=36176 RepID=UPI001CB88301|nr:cysteine-rich DPF motif domain-containing protein 1 isoform X2 [Chiloscyllium plagiosum]